LQNTILTILLGVAVLLAIGLFYLGFSDQSGLSASQWAWFAAFTLTLPLVVFAPIVLGQWRGTPPAPPLSQPDIRFYIAVVAVLCPLAFFAVWEWGAYGTFVIMLVPMAFILRSPRRGLGNTDSRNT
jgi:hypothetical protein